MSAQGARIGIQLHTLREHAERDLPRLLARLAEVGFAGAELASLHGHAARVLREWLDAAGLAVPSLHGRTIEATGGALLDDAEALGASAVVVSIVPPERFASEAEIDAVADQLARASEAARARGLALGYHNHFWEWRPLASGELGWNRLFARLPAEVFAEVDVYWARLAGQDPAAVIRRLGTRAPLVHVKDGPADAPASPMLAVGDGAVDIPAVLAAARHARWHFVELDRCDGDMLEAVERSFLYLARAQSSGARR